MLTEIQRKKLHTRIKDYKKKYLLKKHSELDESGTRIMINAFLTSVLEYEELEEIKTEYAIRGTYADYVIQLGNVQHVIVEVKAIQLSLSDKHIRQAVNYGANEGISWVLLTNGQCFNLYRVIIDKKVSHKEIFSIDLNDTKGLKNSSLYFQYLTKRCVSKGDLEKYWKKFLAVEPQNLCKYLYKKEIVNFLRRSIKKDQGLSFSEDDILDSVHNIITTKIESIKPRSVR